MSPSTLRKVVIGLTLSACGLVIAAAALALADLPGGQQGERQAGGAWPATMSGGAGPTPRVEGVRHDGPKAGPVAATRPTLPGSAAGARTSIYTVVNTILYQGKQTYTGATAIILGMRRMPGGRPTDVRYEFQPLTIAASMFRQPEPLVLAPREGTELPAIRAARHLVSQQIQIEGAAALSGFVNNLFVALPARGIEENWVETVKLFDLQEDRGFLPASCVVNYASRCLGAGGRDLQVVSFESVPFAFRLIDDWRQKAECRFAGVAVFDGPEKRLVQAAWSFRGTVSEDAGQSDFEDRCTIFESDPATGGPVVAFDADARLSEAMDRVLTARAVSAAPSSAIAPPCLGQLLLVSRTAQISSAYVAERRSNPVILAVIGAVYAADTIWTLATDLLNDGMPNVNGDSFTERGMKAIFGAGADAIGLDPKYKSWVDTAAEVTNLGVGLVASGGLKGLGAIKIGRGAKAVKATSLHYSLWSRIGHGSSWAKSASELLPALDTYRRYQKWFDLYDDVDTTLWMGQKARTLTASGRGVSVILIFDNSGSMDRVTGGERKIDWARRALKEVVRTVTPGQDTEWSLFTFAAGRPHLLVPFSSDPQQLVRLSESMMARGDTPLAATIDEAARYARASARFDRIQLIILSDGQDTCGGDPVVAAARFRQLSGGAVEQPQPAPGRP